MKTCPTCGKPFEGRNGKFCSAQCYHEGQKQKLTSHKPHSEYPCICNYCGKSFVLSRKPSQWTKGYYCSVDCANKAQGTNRRRSTRGDRVEIYKAKKGAKCPLCGFGRFIEACHIHREEPLTWDNNIFMCPNHHRLFDSHLLNSDEIEHLPENARKAYLAGETYDNLRHMRTIKRKPRQNVLQDSSGKFAKTY